MAREVEADLDAIWEYIARDNLDAADCWLATLFDGFAAVATNPDIGHTRKDLTSCEVRFWPVESYLIVYRIQPHRLAIEIVAVVQGIVTSLILEWRNL